MQVQIQSIQNLNFPFKMSNSGGRRLKQWLMEQIQSGQYSGLQWEDDCHTLFRIPWKHAGKQDYNQEVDASIFKVWRHSCKELAHRKRSSADVLFACFPHRPGLCLRASIRRETRPNLLPGRPDCAVPWTRALISRRWRIGHSWTSQSLIKSTALYRRKSRRVSLCHCGTNVTHLLQPFCPFDAWKSSMAFGRCIALFLDYCWTLCPNTKMLHSCKRITAIIKNASVHFQIVKAWRWSWRLQTLAVTPRTWTAALQSWRSSRRRCGSLVSLTT